MVPTILPLIAPHKLYCEPYFGGGAILFAKEPSRIEVINDLNGEAVNFYRVMKSEFDALNEEVQSTLHSRDLYRDALVIYNNPHLFDVIKRAWAFWILTNQGFSCKIGTWGYDKSSGSLEKKVYNAKQRFTIDYALRLEKVQIECNDALRVIASRDSIDSFFYLDPPYFNSNCGHYAGYGEQEFLRLLDLLSQIQGRFLLSSYPSPALSKHTNSNGWYQQNVTKSISVTQHAKGKKVEMLTANYPIEIAV